MSLLIFILILVGLILVHEFGHFIVAKAFGIRVDEFGIFFPPRLFAVRKGETEYSLNLLPFGGFVKIFGENEPSQNIPAERSSNLLEDSARPFPRDNSASVSFAQKSKWVQAAVIVAGIVFNLLFAWGLLTAGYLHGIPTSVDHQGVGVVQNAHPTIVAVLPGSPADKAGLKAGDTIVSVLTGHTTLAEAANAEQVQEFIAAHQNESIGFSVLRGKEEVGAIAKPADGLVEGKRVVGIELGDVGMLKLPLHLALVQGALLGKEITVSTAEGLAGFFAQVVRGTANYSQVSGPIGIAGMGSSAVQQGFVATILLTALISINLAIINLIPIPGLDGGRLLFIAIEGITRRPISPRVSVALTIAGFALLIALMLVVSYHDVLRLVKPA